MKLLRIQQQYGDSTRINYKYTTVPTTAEELLFIIKSLPQTNPVTFHLQTIKSPLIWCPENKLFNADIQKELELELLVLRQNQGSTPGTWHYFVLDIIDTEEFKAQLKEKAKEKLNKIPKTNSNYSLILDFYATTGFEKDIKAYRKTYFGDAIALDDTLHLHADDNNHIIDITKIICTHYLADYLSIGNIRGYNKEILNLETFVEKHLIDAMLSNQTQKIHVDNINIDNACWSDTIQSCIFINTEDSYHQSIKDELQKKLTLLESYEKLSV